MRALFVSHTYIPRFNREKLRMIAGQGVEVGLLAPGNWRNIGGLFDGQPAPLEEPSADPEIRVFAARTLRPGHIASYIFDPLAVRRILRTFRPDVIQVEQEVYSFAAAQIALQRSPSQRLVIFSWENLDRPVHPLQRVARKITLRRADLVVSGNRAGADLMRRWDYRGQVEVLPQVGVDPARYPPRPAEAEGALLRIGFVGRLAGEKGGDLLLRAAAQLVARGLAFRLMFCGSGPCEAEWRSLAEALGLAGRTDWHGSVPHAEVPRFMAQMDILVLPSRTISTWSEQFGLVLPQAMLVGMPVIGSNCGAIPEVIGLPEAIFPEGDPGALAAILERLLHSPDLRSQWRMKGRTRALTHYSAEHIARETVRIWKEIKVAPSIVPPAGG
jgi:glycosyltransferase involved in cell wall biosynthesis